MQSQEIKRTASARWMSYVASLAPVARTLVTTSLSGIHLRQWWAAISQTLIRLFQSDRAFAGLLALCYAFYLTPSGTNTLSRYDMVYALAHGTAIIDIHAGNTIDVSYYQGHWYSPRSLGLSLVATPLFWLLSLVANTDDTTRFTLTQQISILNAFTVVPVAIMCAVALRRFAAHLRPSLASTPLPTVVAGAFALGTLAYPFSTKFFSHAFGGGLAFIAFYLAYRARDREHSALWMMLSGLLMGLAVISEYPVGVVAVLLLPYIWLVFPQQRLQMLGAYILGALPSVLLLGWYNWFAFGNPFRLSYAYVSDDQFSGQHQGFFGITTPHLDSLWSTLVYPRGLLMESPFLLLVPLGLALWLRASYKATTATATQQSVGSGFSGFSARIGRWLATTRAVLQSPRAPEALVVALVVVLYPLAISSYFLPMAGENLPGPRLLVPMLPFACLALIWVVDRPQRWLRIAFSAMLAYGVAMSYLFVALGVRIFHTYSAFPLADLYWPLIRTGIVPAKDGPTPQSLLTVAAGIPNNFAFWILPLFLALWTILAIRGILRHRTRRITASAHPASEVESEPQPSSNEPEAVATRAVVGAAATP